MNIPLLSNVPNQSQSSRDPLAPVRTLFERGIRPVSFWLAVTIPFFYLPLILQGFTQPSDVLTFLGLLVVNVVALVVGHEHSR